MEDGHFAVLDKRSFDKILTDIKLNERLMHAYKFEKMSCFKGWSEECVLELFDFASEVKFNYNQIIYR
jgi:hypothetical protein